VFLPPSKSIQVIFLRFITQAFNERSFSKIKKKKQVWRRMVRILEAWYHRLAEKKAKNSAKQRGTGEDERADGGGVTS